MGKATAALLALIALGVVLLSALRQAAARPCQPKGGDVWPHFQRINGDVTR